MRDKRVELAAQLVTRLTLLLHKLSAGDGAATTYGHSRRV